MKFQKILSLVSLIVAALCIVLGLCFCSGVMSEIINYNSDKFSIGCANLYEYSQKVNNTVLIMAIVLLLVVVTLFITSCNKRRNYYITNYISIALVVAYSVAFAIALIVICAKCSGYANEIDYVKWKEFYDAFTKDRYGNVSYTNPRNYSESRITIILGIVLAVVLIAEVAAWVLNLIWKIKLMQGEKALLANGVEVKSMEVA